MNGTDDAIRAPDTPAVPAVSPPADRGPAPDSAAPPGPAIPGTRIEAPLEKAQRRRRQEKLSTYMLVILLVGLTLAFLPIIRLFFVPLVLAATFAALFYPLYEWLTTVFRGNHPVSSLACCVILLLGLLIPAYLLIHLVVLQVIGLYATAEPFIHDIIEKGAESEIVQRVRTFPIIQWMQLSKINWSGALQEAGKAAATLSTNIMHRTSAGIFSLIANVFTMLFTMFYFFLDGKELIKRLRYLSPLRAEYEEMFFSRFLLISRATIKGTVLIGLVQGTLGALTLLMFGVRTWLLWGFVMVILAIMPLVGAWLVLLPAAIIQILLGNIWQGVGILLVNVVVISNVDNLIRPRLVGRGAKMHDLMIFFSTLGGISVFGVMGFIVGPVIAALFITVIDIYGAEFKPQLTSPDDPRSPTRTSIPVIRTPEPESEP